MTMNRRNVLIGLGATAAGGGAVLGSGAFSQVEADRSVSFTVANDSAAIVALDGSTSSYASTTTSDGTEVLQITVQNLNEDAVTTIDDLFTVTNNDSDGNAETITLSDGSNAALNWTSSGNQTYGVSGDNLENGVTVAEGNAVGVSLEIDTTSSGGDPTTVSQITITAN